MNRFTILALAGLALAACGKSSGSQDQLAYEACLGQALELS